MCIKLKKAKIQEKAKYKRHLKKEIHFVGNYGMRINFIRNMLFELLCCYNFNVNSVHLSNAMATEGKEEKNYEQME